MTQSTLPVAAMEGEQQVASNKDLEKTPMTRGGEEEGPLDPPGTCFNFRTFMRYTGPGWLMSLAYLDPGNLEADLQSGAYTGYSLIWVLALSTLAGLILQILAARLGAVTGRHLAQTCRAEYPRPVAYMLWIMTEVAIIGADVQEVVGSAIAFRELFGWPLWLGSVVTGVDTFTFLAVHHCGRSLLEILIFTLVMGMMVCFFTNWALEPAPITDIMGGFVPQAPSYAIVQLVGTVGAVIMPHNIYLHSGLVSDRPVNRRSDASLKQANKYNVADSAVALIVSFVINLALVTSFAGTFFSVSCAEVTGGPFACVAGLADEGNGQCTTGNGLAGFCGEIGLETAGNALQHVFRDNGSLARAIFALGVLSAGQASTMTGTFAGQYVMEGFLEWRIPIWARTLITRAASLGPAIAVALLTAENENLNNKVNQWINILQSVQLPFALLPVLIFTSDTRIMGSYASGPVLQSTCWILALIIMGLNAQLVVQAFDGSSATTWAIVGICFVLYLALIVTLIWRVILQVAAKLRASGSAREETPRTLAAAPAEIQDSDRNASSSASV